MAMAGLASVRIFSSSNSTLSSSRKPSYNPQIPSRLNHVSSNSRKCPSQKILTTKPSTLSMLSPILRPTKATPTASPSTTSNTFHGVCFVVGDNIDTDQIIPAEYCTLNPSNPKEYNELGLYALSGLPKSYKVRFVEEDETKSKYSIIIGGDNFGCGSSREHAPMALGAAGAVAVVAESYVRIFFRNSVSTGELYPLESEVRICEEFTTGDVATIDPSEGTLVNHTTGKEYKLKPIGDAGPVIEAGGIFDYARKAGMIPSLAA